MSEPEFATIKQARRHLGNCSRSFIYDLIKAGKLESVNPLGRMRLISMESIRRLLEAGEARECQSAGADD